jgi:hypothetical protein
MSRPGSRLAVSTLVVLASVTASCSFGAESAPRTIPGRQRGSLSIGFGSPLSLDGEVRIYLPRSDADGALGSVGRTIEESDDDLLLFELIEVLVAGPTNDERSQGYETAIPRGIRVLEVTPAGNRVTIDLSGPLAGLPADELIAALAQIVYTVSEGFFIREATITIDGAEVSWPRQDGTFTDRPLTIFDYPTAAITSQPAYPGIIPVESAA